MACKRSGVRIPIAPLVRDKFEILDGEYSSKVLQRWALEAPRVCSDRGPSSARSAGRVLGLWLLPEAVKLVSCENALVQSPLTLAAHPCAAVLAPMPRS
jgi:hypothetical protein